MKKVTKVDPEVQAAINALWSGDANLTRVHTECVNGHFHIEVGLEVEFGLEVSQAIMDGLVRRAKHNLARKKRS